MSGTPDFARRHVRGHTFDDPAFRGPGDETGHASVDVELCDLGWVAVHVATRLIGFRSFSAQADFNGHLVWSGGVRVATAVTGMNLRSMHAVAAVHAGVRLRADCAARASIRLLIGGAP